MADASTVAPFTIGTADLSAPLYIAWQITNECNLNCLHCIEESGPGKAFKDELSDQQIFSVLEQVMAANVPYISFSGGEPMLHPRFFEMVEYVCDREGNLKIETNGHYLTPEACARLKLAGVKAVQVSLDGVSPETFGPLRIRGDFDTAVQGIRNLKAAGVPIEINYSPTRFNADAIGEAVDLAYDLGAYSFYTGRTMYTGNAVKSWKKMSPTDEQYVTFFKVLKEKADEYKDRMRVYYHEMGLFEELRYRLDHPAALLIVLPNGLVKLINALPFVCGDFRKQSLEEIWQNFLRVWQQPEVAQFIKEMEADPSKTSALHKWVFL